MTYESLIENYNRLKFKIKRLELKISEFKSLGEYPKPGDGMPKAKNSSSIVENIVIKISKLSDEKLRLEKELELQRSKIVHVIDSVILNIVQKEVLELKTFSPYLSWKDIAKKEFLSVSRVRHLHQDGISEINKFLSNEGGNYGL